MENSPLMGTGIQTGDSSTSESNTHLHQREASEASDIHIIPRLLENHNDSQTTSQDLEIGDHVASNLTATQQAVILAYCLLIEKSSRHDELQRKLPYFVLACMISCLAYADFHIPFVTF